MILQDQVLDVAIQGNFTTTSFGIAGNAKSYDVLSKKIYRKKVQAVIREISCNAQDAHTDADQDAQFRVHLPTGLEPWFAVRDYGFGLSEQQVREIFCIYFCSTKTNSNKAIGCLGLGSKSPFAISDSFTVTSWFNGKKTVYSCYKDAKKEPQIAELTSEDSDEPTGIEVKLTVNGRSEEFKKEAIRVFQYFDKQPIINSREVVDAIVERQKYQIVHPEFSVNRHYGKLMAVMGNVAYNIPTDDDNDKNEENYDYDAEHKFEDVPRIQGFLRFEIGELDFDPGREELSLDARTVAIVNAKMELFRNEIQALVEKEIEQQPTFYKKCVAYEQLNAGALGDLIRLKDKYKLPESTTKFTKYEKSRHRKAVSKSEETEFAIDDDNQVFFHEPRFEARIRQYLKGRGEGTVILLTAEQITEMQIDLDIMKKLEDVIPKLDRAARGSRAVNIKTFVWNGETSGTSDSRTERASSWDSVTVDLADTSEEKVYVELNNWKIENTVYWCRSTNEIAWMNAQCRKYGVEVPQVYGLKTAVLDTKGFKSGNWIKLEDYIRREITAHAPKIVYTYNGYGADIVTAVANVIQSQELLSLVDILKLVKQTESTVSFFEKFGISIPADNTADTIEADFFKSHPMLQFMSASQIRGNSQLVRDYVSKCHP